MRTETTVALIVAAGQGIRAGGGIPKQYRSIGGAPILGRSLKTFLGHPRIDRVLVVTGADDAPHYAASAPQHAKLLPAGAGGAAPPGSRGGGLASPAAGTPRGASSSMTRCGPSRAPL